MAKNPGAIVLLLAGMMFAGMPGMSQDSKNAASLKKGRALYEQYCVSCHGREGRGDGPAASALKVRPPDLGTIGKRNKGFSQQKVYDQISGERFVVGHGLREMPVWGKAFRDVEGGDQKAASDLSDLTRYLQSIQKQ